MYPRSFRLWPVQPVAWILPVLSVMGVQPVGLCPRCCFPPIPAALASPPGWMAPPTARRRCRLPIKLGISFHLFYTGYLGGEEQAALAQLAFSLWPQAHKVVDPVLGDGGHAYSTVTPAFIQRNSGSVPPGRLDPSQLHRGEPAAGHPSAGRRDHPGYRPGPGRQSCLSCPQCGGHRSAHGQLYRLCRGRQKGSLCAQKTAPGP